MGIETLELLFLIYTPVLVLFGFLLMSALLAFKRTRRAAKKLGLLLIAAVLFYISVVLSGNLYREHRAESVIEQTQPVVDALEQFRTQTGTYPLSLDDLMPAYIKTLPAPRLLQERGKTYPIYIYETSGETYHLRFWLPGPPFGHHFIYTPSKEYPDWWELGVFQLKKRIGNWGWYLKV